MSLSELLILGFVIGLTGALAPGPTLIATIQASIQSGWMSGPRVTGGHIIAEFLVIILIAAGIPFLPSSSTMYIAGVGGVALIIFGIMTLKSAQGATFQAPKSAALSHSPLAAGLITSISNPYFWIWWFSVGSALLISSLASGLAGLIAFISGHWLSDLSWFTFVSVSVHKSRVFIGDREYRIILLVCGLILIAFGGWFIFSGLSLPG
jgi:threonine/homoserine/homoserine lactone efflux protein